MNELLVKVGKFALTTAVSIPVYITVQNIVLNNVNFDEDESVLNALSKFVGTTVVVTTVSNLVTTKYTNEIFAGISEVAKQASKLLIKK